MIWVGLATLGVVFSLTMMVASSSAQTPVVVVPNSFATTEGDANNVAPFNIGGASEMRYQQVFAASDFASFSGPQNITQIAFRPDARWGSAFSSTLDDIQINLSTTAKAPDGLSISFSSNIGSDETVVYSGPLSLSSEDIGPAEGPKLFDIVIDLQSSFEYDPDAGNLLLDVRNFSGGITTPFDSTDFTVGDSTSRVRTRPGRPMSSVGRKDSLGLVVQFTITSRNAPPDCSGASSSVDRIWPPNHGFVPVNVLGVMDPDGDPVTITINSIFQDEPTNKPGGGASESDGWGVGTSTAMVRAERSGSRAVKGNGRVYHIVFTADDGQGASCSSEVLVGVPHGKRHSPVDDGALFDSTIP